MDSIFSLLIHASACIFAVNTCSMIEERIEKLVNAYEVDWIKEWQLRRCGQLLANRYNVESAEKYLSAVDPPAQSQIQIVANQLIHELHQNIERDCGGIVWNSIEVYREKNPKFPEYWPNWRYRVTGRFN